MEVLIVAAFAIVVIVLLDAAYWVVLCLVRWVPSLVVGAILGWLASGQGLQNPEALGLGILTAMLARRVAALRLVRH